MNGTRAPSFVWETARVLSVLDWTKTSTVRSPGGTREAGIVRWAGMVPMCEETVSPLREMKTPSAWPLLAGGLVQLTVTWPVVVNAALSCCSARTWKELGGVSSALLYQNGGAVMGPAAVSAVT